jgi:hypothetical protein
MMSKHVFARSRFRCQNLRVLGGAVGPEPWLTLLRTMVLGIVAASAFSAPAQTNKYVARVSSVVVYKMDSSVFSALTAEQKTNLEQQGMILIESQHTLQSPALPLAGYWLQLGTRRFLTDKNGYVRVQAKPANNKRISVYAHFSDKSPVGVLGAITFVPEGQEPPVSTIMLTYAPPKSMDGSQHASPNSSNTTRARSSDDHCGGTLEVADAIPSQCIKTTASVVEGVFDGGSSFVGPNVTALVGRDSMDVPSAFPPPPAPACRKRSPCVTGSNAKPGCCLDYNGALGDGEPYFRTGSPECIVKGLTNFTGST